MVTLRNPMLCQRRMVILTQSLGECTRSAAGTPTFVAGLQMETTFKGSPFSAEDLEAFSFCHMYSTLALALATCTFDSFKLTLEEHFDMGTLTSRRVRSV